MKRIKTILALILAHAIVLAQEVLVQVNGKDITLEDARFFVANTLSNTTYEKLTLEQKEMVKNRLIEKTLFSQEAIKDGIQERSEFKIHIQRLKEDLLVKMWIQEQLANTVVSDSEAYDFYRANQARFTEPSMLHLRHIVLSDRQEAISMIEALSQLEGKELRSSFISLAQEKSITKTAKNGGDMGFVPTSQLDIQSLSILKDLSNGEITKEPFLTKEGYNIFYLEETSLPKTLPYEKVKDSILASLKQKQLNSHLIEVAKELKNKAKITIPSDNIDK